MKTKATAAFSMRGFYLGNCSKSTTTVTMQFSDDATTAYNALIDDDLVPVNVTQNTSLDMNGVAGYARITVANYGSSTVTFKVLNAVDNRL